MVIRKTPEGLFEMTSKTIMLMIAIFTLMNMLLAGTASWISTRNTVQMKLDATIFSEYSIRDSAWKDTHILATELRNRQQQATEQVFLKNQEEIIVRLRQIACKDQPSSCR